MKRIFITIISLSILCTGCKKFLDVKPQGESTQAEMFSTQKGFRDALTGAYLRMKDGNIYGNALMWGNIEYMAGNWANVTPSNLTLTNLIAGNYTDLNVRNTLDATYQSLYKVIADVNAILTNVDDKKSVFTEGNYGIIKGESLTLRAFCHFDALRMYGPIPDNPGAGRILPYVKTVTKDTHEPISYQEFAQMILADLNEAELLLKDVDPITKYSLAQLNPGKNDAIVLPDNYLMYRQVRMNYYAVLALKARVYLWLSASDASNKINASRYAKMVIDGVDQNGAPTFRLGVENDRANLDFTMSPEHIMALSVYNLDEIARGTFGEDGTLQREDLSYNLPTGYYYLNNLFPVNDRTNDIRWKEMWSYKTAVGKTNYVIYKKYIQKPGLPENKILQVPLLRLSEMYLIRTECADSKGEAESIYAAYCDKKGIPFTGFNATDWISDRKNKMIREYVREFYAEGQTFFTYKRFNLATLPASWTSVYYNVKPEKYLIPKPDREISYTN